MGAWLDDDFAHCNQVMIIDNNNQFESWENSHKNGDEQAMLLLAAEITHQNVDVLITNHLPPCVQHLFATNNIKIIEKSSGTVLTLVEEARAEA